MIKVLEIVALVLMIGMVLALLWCIYALPDDEWEELERYEWEEDEHYDR